MYYLCAILLVLQMATISKAKPYLEIIRSVNGTEVAVSSKFHASAGTNLTLICKVINTTTTKTVGRFAYLDNGIFWGWKRPNIQFTNETDLEILAMNSSNPVLQFYNSSNRNQATISFQTLSVSDSGKYFCNSVKYNLFKIVTVDVTRRWSEKLSDITKASCTDKMFICNNRKSCIESEHVCDNILDCSDGSDENNYLCGKTRCEGKTKCPDGRCIKESDCCGNRQQHTKCLFILSPVCCKAVNNGSKENIHNTKTGIHILRVPSYHIPSYHVPSYNVPSYNGPNLNNHGWATNTRTGLNNYHIPNTLNKPSYTFKTNSIPTVKTSGSLKLGKKVLWIILAPFIALGAAIKCIINKCKGKNKTQSPADANAISLSNVYQGVPTSDTSGTTQPNNGASDLPPTYNDIVTKNPETRAVLVNRFNI